MISAGVFQTVEFYVTAAVIAAMIVGLMAMPRRHGAARQSVLEADLLYSGNDEPSLSVEARDDGSVILVRRGLAGLTSSAIVKLLVTIIGNDITIEESVTQGSAWSEPADTAMAVLDMIGHDRYHVKYISDPNGQRFAAFTLNNRPGFKATRPLKD